MIGGYWRKPQKYITATVTVYITYLYVRTAGNSSRWAMSSCPKMSYDQPGIFL